MSSKVDHLVAALVALEYAATVELDEYVKNCVGNMARQMRTQIGSIVSLDAREAFEQALADKLPELVAAFPRRKGFNEALASSFSASTVSPITVTRFAEALVAAKAPTR